MKVLVINRHYQGGGGAETAVRGLVELLETQNHEVTVLSLKPNQPSFTHQKGITSWYIQTMSNNFSTSRVLRFLLDGIDFFSPFRIFRYIRKREFDIVHTHNIRGMGMFLPLTIRFARYLTPPPNLPLFRGRKLRWYHTAHDIQLVYPSGTVLYPGLESYAFARMILIKVYAHVQKFIWGAPDMVISPSQFLSNFYHERGFFKQSAMRCVPNVMHPLSISSLPGGEVRRSFLFVGVLEESKGIRVLLDAYTELLRDNPQCSHKLEIIGNGSLYNVLHAAYRSDKIIFHGDKSSEELESFYQRGFVTIVPSITLENAPTVIRESFHCGVPVIASRIGGIPELVDEGVTGWLTEPGDREELIQRFQSLLQEGIQDRMRSNCQRIAIETGIRAVTAHTKLYVTGLDKAN